MYCWLLQTFSDQGGREKFRLELQSVVHIMLNWYMIMCDLPFVRTMEAAEMWCDTSLPLWHPGLAAGLRLGSPCISSMLSRSCFLGILFVLTSRNHWRGAGLNPLTPLTLLSWSLYSWTGMTSGMYLISCHINGRSGKNLEGIMWYIGHVDCFLLYSSWLNKFEEHSNPVVEKQLKFVV